MNIPQFLLSIKLRYYIITAIIILASAGIYYYIANKSLSVDKTIIEKRKVLKTVSSSGKIKSELEVNLSFKLGGKISKIYKKKGDLIKPGDILASIDRKSAQANVKAYKDALDIKLRERDLFLEQYQDNKEAIGGSKEYDISLRKLNEQISQADATYKAQIIGIDDYDIKSPITGIILDVTKEENETVSFGETVVIIADPSRVIFESYIDQEDFGLIREGQDTKINLDAYDGKEFKGKIARLPFFANISGNNIDQFTVDIALDKSDVPFLIGMKGDADIAVAQTDSEVNTLVFDEIFEDKDKNEKYVWVLENGKLKKQIIDIGLEGDAYTEIRTNLEDKVIVVPINKNDKLEEGIKAKIQTK